MRLRPNERPTTEAELCDALVVAAERSGWDVYPEVAGWDLVLVWSGRVAIPSYLFRGIGPPEPGHQIVVEAKLRANCDAIWSAVSRARFGDETAVLVPNATRDFVQLCQYLNIRVFQYPGTSDSYELRMKESIFPGRSTSAQRLTLPPIALKGSGGMPSPRTLSPWRVGALRICAVLRSRGWITGDDFKAHGIDRHRWVARKWVVGDGKIGKLTRYVAGANADVDGPDVGYEKERDALRELDNGAAG